MVKSFNFTEKEKYVSIRINKFYSDIFNLEKLYNLLCCYNKNSKISLSVINWFVTNYSKKYDIVYHINRPCGRIDYFSVYRSYKAHMIAYSKKLFDPYCRGTNLVQLEYNDHKFETNIAQLNFLKWVFENLILEYISSNIDHIILDKQQNETKTNKNAIKKTKQRLSISIHNKMLCSDELKSVKLIQLK